MLDRLSGRTAVGLVMLICGLWTFEALAGPGVPECKGTAAQAAREHNRKAAKLVDQEKYAEAYDQLSFAFKLCPDPRVLLNMAKLCRHMERYCRYGCERELYHYIHLPVEACG